MVPHEAREVSGFLALLPGGPFHCVGEALGRNWLGKGEGRGNKSSVLESLRSLLNHPRGDVE